MPRGDGTGVPETAAAVEAKVGWVALQQPARAEIVFVQNVNTKNHTLSDNHVIKKRAQSVVRK